MDDKRQKNNKGGKKLDVILNIEAQTNYKNFVASLLLIPFSIQTPSKLIAEYFYNFVSSFYLDLINLEKKCSEHSFTSNSKNFSQEEQCFYKQLVKAVKEFQLPLITQTDLIHYYQNKIKELPDEERQIPTLKRIEAVLNQPLKFKQMSLMRVVKSKQAQHSHAKDNTSSDATIWKDRDLNERLSEVKKSTHYSMFSHITKIDNVLRICSKMLGEFRFNNEMLLNHFKEKIIDDIQKNYPQKTVCEGFTGFINKLCILLSASPKFIVKDEEPSFTRRVQEITRVFKGVTSVTATLFQEQKPPEQMQAKGLKALKVHQEKHVTQDKQANQGKQVIQAKLLSQAKHQQKEAEQQQKEGILWDALPVL